MNHGIYYIAYICIDAVNCVNGSRNSCFFQICQCYICIRTTFKTLWTRTNYENWINYGRWRCTKILCASSRVTGAQSYFFCLTFGSWTTWWWCAQNVNKIENHLTRTSASAWQTRTLKTFVAQLNRQKGLINIARNFKHFLSDCI